MMIMNQMYKKKVEIKNPMEIKLKLENFQIMKEILLMIMNIII